MADHDIMEVRGVTKRYGKFTVLDSVSFDLHANSHVILLGQNGAGKTTLLKCIMGLTRFQGSILVEGMDVRKKSKFVKRKIGYVPQTYAFYNNLTIEGHMKLATRLKQIDRHEIQEKLESIDLWNVRKKRVGSLSSGMRQRLGIAQALLGDPPLLLLDEPTSNVDYRGRAEFRAVLQRLLSDGKTLITTTHLPGLTEIATEVIIIDKGKIIAEGPPLDLARKIGIVHTIRVRYGSPSSLPKIDEVQKLPGVIKIENGDAWINLVVSDESKMDVVRKLSSNPNVLDLIVEPVAIDSEYLRMVGQNN